MGKCAYSSSCFLVSKIAGDMPEVYRHLHETYCDMNPRGCHIHRLVEVMFSSGQSFNYTEAVSEDNADGER